MMYVHIGVGVVLAVMVWRPWRWGHKGPVTP